MLAHVAGVPLEETLLAFAPVAATALAGAGAFAAHLGRRLRHRRA